jgi:L-seryl-tRNA(Ser) seleniumtransferase
VHPSNYRVVGFTASPSLEEIAELARKHGLIFYEDAGSGALMDLSHFGIDGEPMISESIAAGADIVTFSGDKLMGGPQCGLIVGRGELIERLRKNPLYRALRVDKLTYAAVQATLEAYSRGTAADEIPVLASLAEKAEAIEKRVEKFVDRLRSEVGKAADIASLPGESAVGGGAAPTVLPPTRLLSVRSISKTPENVAEELRMRDVPVISRIADDRVVVDLRTVFEDEEEELLKALVDVLNGGS